MHFLISYSFLSAFCRWSAFDGFRVFTRSPSDRHGVGLPANWTTTAGDVPFCEEGCLQTWRYSVGTLSDRAVQLEFQAKLLPQNATVWSSEPQEMLWFWMYTWKGGPSDVQQIIQTSLMWKFKLTEILGPFFLRNVPETSSLCLSWNKQQEAATLTRQKEIICVS